MPIDQSVDSWVIMDWVHYVKDTVPTPIDEPQARLEQQLRKCLTFVGKNNCLLFLVLEQLITDPQSYMYVEGVHADLFRPGIIHFQVMKMGGYKQPWDAKYYRRFVRNQAEADFFEYYLGLYEDASMAGSGSPPIIGKRAFESWDDVKQYSRRKLTRGVRVIKKRFVSEGVQSVWESGPIEPSEKPPIVRQVFNALQEGYTDVAT